MTLNELKLVAKRLRKHHGELLGRASPVLSQALALELAAKLHGYRNYHEAQERLAQRSLLETLKAEPGGILAAQGVAFDMSSQLLEVRGNLTLVAPPGRGKSMLCNELIVQALFCGRKVRVIDCGGSYRRLAQMLGGAYFTGTMGVDAYEAWASEAPFVVLDIEEPRNAGALDASLLQKLPVTALAVWDECWMFRSAYQPLPCATTISVGQALSDFVHAGICRLEALEGHVRESTWRWTTSEGSIECRLYIGPRRLAVYTTRPEHLRQMGQPCDADRLEKFAASLQPVFG